MRNPLSINKRFPRLASWLLGLLGIVAFIVSGMAVLGVPDFVTRWVLSGVNSGEYFIQTQQVYLDLAGGLNARNVRVYRKGIPGPPFLESRECRVLYHFFEWPRPGRSRIKELRAQNGTLRPLWTSGRPGLTNNFGLATGGTPGQGKRAAAMQVDLDVVLSDFEVLGVWVEGVRTAVRVDAEGIFLSRLSGKIGRDLLAGTIEGTLAWGNDGQLTGRVATSFDPRNLIPVCNIFYPSTIKVLEQFSFPVAPPRMDLTFDVNSNPPIFLKAKGRIQASSYAYRGAAIGFAGMSGEYVLGNGTNRLEIDPFSMTIGGRHARGEMAFDIAAGVVDFQVNSEVNLASVLRLIGLKESFMSVWSFEEGTRVIAKGRIGYSTPEVSEVDAVVDGPKIGYRGIAFSNYSFAYRNKGYTHTFSDIRATAGGGAISGSAVLEAEQPSLPWTANANIEIINADVDDCFKLVNTNLGWRMGGKVFGNLQFAGVGADLVGNGQLTVRDAQIFKIPVIAELLDKGGALVRDVDLSEVQADLRFSFELKNRLIKSHDFSLDLGGGGLMAEGSCGLDGSLDWILRPARTSNKKILGRAVMRVLAPLHLGQFSLSGTVRDPIWQSLSDK